MYPFGDAPARYLLAVFVAIYLLTQFCICSPLSAIPAVILPLHSLLVLCLFKIPPHRGTL